MQVLEHYIGKLPILGVCLGHQAIGESFGAKLVKGHKPMHGKVSTVSCRQNALFREMPSKFEVVRYHSLVLEDVKAPLRVIAHTNDEYRAVMAVCHTSLPVWGVQWHPEAHLSQYGLRLITNWLDVARQHQPGA
jgi:anthranilate synthase component 2